MRTLPALCLLLLAAACDDAPEARPPAHELTADAVGYYCSMLVAEHPGPKAQLHLRGRDAPLWFSSVRDAVAFTMMPGEAKNVVAIYVNDMAGADWDAPGPGIWIDAESAIYVVESALRGGMGAAEAVPFGSREAAQAFAERHGGRLVAWHEISQDYVFGTDAQQLGARHGS